MTWHNQTSRNSSITGTRPSAKCYDLCFIISVLCLTMKQLQKKICMFSCRLCVDSKEIHKGTGKLEL